MERVVILICYVRNNNNNNNAIYKAHVSTLQSAQGAIDTIDCDVRAMTANDRLLPVTVPDADVS